MPQKLSNPQQYEAAFRLLVADFLVACEYVEPADCNLKVYSHRLYELLLRACTEFESVCKQHLQSEGQPLKLNANIEDYALLGTTLGLSHQVATLFVWQPTPVDLTPFADWSKAKPSLAWYRDYNQVKHNRHEAFARANLLNVRDALAGVFIVLARLGCLTPLGGCGDEPGSMLQGTYTYQGLPFGLRYDHDLERVRQR